MDLSQTETLPVPKPDPQAIDVFGLSHQGRVRPENQDQFLIASLHKTMQVHHSSLAPDQLGRLTSDSRGYLFLVADGLGGRPAGQEASGTALQAFVDYVTHAMDLYTSLEGDREAAFVDQLRRAVERSHLAVLAAGEKDSSRTGMATTLTMVAVRWPRAYLVHVGDSRCYRLRGGKLERMTEDQTIAQAMIDAGVLSTTLAEDSELRHVLYSAIGAHEARPVIRVEEIQWQDVMLLCSDGLTKHVSDAEIEVHLASVRSAEDTCRALLNQALERGGTDNITVVIGRVRAAQ